MDMSIQISEMCSTFDLLRERKREREREREGSSRCSI